MSYGIAGFRQREEIDLWGSISEEVRFHSAEQLFTSLRCADFFFVHGEPMQWFISLLASTRGGAQYHVSKRRSDLHIMHDLINGIMNEPCLRSRCQQASVIFGLIDGPIYRYTVISSRTDKTESVRPELSLVLLSTCGGVVSYAQRMHVYLSF